MCSEGSPERPLPQGQKKQRREVTEQAEKGDHAEIVKAEAEIEAFHSDEVHDRMVPLLLASALVVVVAAVPVAVFPEIVPPAEGVLLVPSRVLSPTLNA